MKHLVPVIKHPRDVFTRPPAINILSTGSPAGAQRAKYLVIQTGNRSRMDNRTVAEHANHEHEDFLLFASARV